MRGEAYRKGCPPTTNNRARTAPRPVAVSIFPQTGASNRNPIVMNSITRREFHRRVGGGMLIAGLGSSLAGELGISTALADTAPQTLAFGELEPLVGFMQDTPLERLQPLVVARLNKGDAGLDDFLRAAALANARCFGGEDYVGMHTLMAMNPAHAMAAQLPAERRALVVLKILYRNTGQILALGGEKTMHAVTPVALTPGRAGAELLREAVHGGERERAEQLFAALAERSPQNAFNSLLHVVDDNTEVHRVVFAHRSWEILDLAGMENAETMLRQSLRYCINTEKSAVEHHPTPRSLLPKLLDEYKLLSIKSADRRADDAWVEAFGETVFSSSAAEAAEAVAAALAEGFSPDDIGEAISMATNQLVLRDIGRAGKSIQPGKPEGSVHGDSIGVHASDSTAAWRGIARVSNHRNAVAALVLAGYQAAYDRTHRGGDFLAWRPRPAAEDLEKIRAREPEPLLRELDGAIRDQDQARACALLHRYGTLGHEARPVIKLLLHYATREDGALHAEKYFLTATGDFATSRPAHRWNHLVALGRVTASEAGQTSPGYLEACDLLGLDT